MTDLSSVDFSHSIALLSPYLVIPLSEVDPLAVYNNLAAIVGGTPSVFLSSALENSPSREW